MNSTTPTSEPTAAPHALRELLVFSYHEVLFAVDATAADTVIPWREPMPLPGVASEVLGVVQDRGRIVTVLAHPAGSPVTDRAPLSRIIVCLTPRGHLGLPASGTKGVTTLEIPTSTAAGQILDTPLGAATYVRPQEIASRLVKSASKPTR